MSKNRSRSRLRAALIAVTTCATLAMASGHAVAKTSEEGSGAPSHAVNHSSPTIGDSFRDSLSLGDPIFTGAYKTIVSGPHVSQVKVYRRYFHACIGESAGLVQNCQDGTITYAAGFAACFNTCTVGGQRGSQECMANGSDTLGVSSTLVSCSSTLLSNGYASKAVETDRLCVAIFGCSSFAWHVNAYPTGNITGPYSGTGVV